jgi:hypothetical protein
MNQSQIYDKLIVGVDIMAQELDYNAEFGITAEERERYNNFVFVRYINEKLAEAETDENNPNAWRDVDDFIAEWENHGSRNISAILKNT